MTVEEKPQKESPVQQAKPKLQQGRQEASFVMAQRPRNSQPMTAALEKQTKRR
jgi:hypothetical protein